MSSAVERRGGRVDGTPGELHEPAARAAGATACNWLRRGVASIAWIASVASISTILALTLASLAAFTPTAVLAQSCAAPGRDGPVTIPLQPNTYFAGAGTAAGSAITFGALDPRGAGIPFAAGDMVLVIQMQDGSTTNFATDGPGYGTGFAGGRAGQYEYAVVATAGAGTLTLTQSLANTYTQNPAAQQTFQVIRVPQYSAATLSGTISPPAWNGTTGGVLAIDVAGALTFAGSIDASGRGFRGGGSVTLKGDGVSASVERYRLPSTDLTGGSKGEGVSGTPRRTFAGLFGGAADAGPPDRYPNGDHGRGAPGTAGGGGTDGNPFLNDQNSGGGGGGNGGTGGRGGNTWFSNKPWGGIGGAAFPATPARVVLGSGGGAGTTNNDTGATVSGAPGGGAVFIRAGSIAGTGLINVDGATAPTTTPADNDDGAGGGGAGGSVVLFAAAPAGLAGVGVSARGGNGGNTAIATEAHGPGGGGGGGVIFANGGLGSSSVAQGAHGITSTASVTPGIPAYTSDYGSIDGSPGVVSLGAGTTGPGTPPGALCIPALTVTKSTVPTGPVRVAAGSNATYRITVANLVGRAAATDVFISDPLPGTPAAFTNQSATPTVTLNAGATRPATSNAPVGATAPVWSSFTIPGGGSVVLEFQANVPANTAAGTYQNPVVATWLDPQRTTTGGTTTGRYDPATSTQEDVIVSNANAIDIVKTVGAVTTLSSTVFDVPFVLRVKNTGANALPNVQVNDFVGPGAGSAFPNASSVTLQAGPTRANLSASEACPASIVVNTGFTGGLTDTRLLTGTGTLSPGEGCAISFTVRVTYAAVANVPTVAQNNIAFASSVNPGPGEPAGNPGYTFGGTTPVPPANPVAIDQSTNSSTLPATPNGDNPSPTPVGFGGVTPQSLTGALSGSVWIETIRNRVRDAGEPGVAAFGVEVTNTATGALLPCAAGVNTSIGCITMPDGRSLFRTDANGNYNVTTIANGEYGVRFRDSASNVSFAVPVNGSNDPGSRLDPDNQDRLIVRISGASVQNQSLPLDPSGVIYNSSNRAPVAGATTTFCGPSTAFNTNLPLISVLVGTGYTAVPGLPHCASMVTGTTGIYQFLLRSTAPAGEYRLSAMAPNLTFPSARIPPANGPLTPPVASGTYLVQQQATPPTGNDSTLYFLAINLVGGAQTVLHNHIPLDPRTGAAMGLEKVATRQTVEIGDSLDYVLVLRNPDLAAPGVVITDRLPRGFSLIGGTLRINGVQAPDPAGAPGPVLNIRVGDVPAGSQVTLTYRVRVGVGAPEGEAVNRASSVATNGIASNPAEAKVRVTGGVFTREACVIGKIYVDCNGNSIQDREELGIPGVRLYFSDGTWMVSDSEGKYSYCGLQPKTHGLKVDRTTLPRGSRLMTSSNRNALDAGSLFIDLKAGELHQADFIEGSCSDTVMRQVKARRAHGEVTAPQTERLGSPPLILRSRNAPIEGNQPVPTPRYQDAPQPVCRNETDCRSLGEIEGKGGAK